MGLTQEMRVAHDSMMNCLHYSSVSCFVRLMSSSRRILICADISSRANEIVLHFSAKQEGH
jgi:hypothetical protein